MPADAYVQHVRDLLDGVPDLRFRRMFGAMGVYSGPRMFALIAGEQLFLKTDGESRAALAAAGSEPFSFQARGRITVTSYWRLPVEAEEDPGEARRWARAALAAAEETGKPKESAGREDLGPGPWDE